ncbi:PQQ-binding-like beta-propeller repeat protein, partial [Planctomycetota bacterium]
RAPVSQLDAKTGKVLKTYDATDHTAEILYREGLLILSVLEEDGVRIKVIETQNGKMRWSSEKTYRGTTTDYYRFRAMHGSVTPAKVDPTLDIATDGKVIALLDGEDVVGLDFKDGTDRWRGQFPLVEADYKAGGIDAQRTVWTGTLIVKDGVVVHASPNQLAAFSARTGEILWTQSRRNIWVISGMNGRMSLSSTASSGPGADRWRASHSSSMAGLRRAEAPGLSASTATICVLESLKSRFRWAIYSKRITTIVVIEIRPLCATS